MKLISQMQRAWCRHWPYYVAEAVGIGVFLLCGSLLTILLQHPASPVWQALSHQPMLRRVLLGVGMGFVIVSIVYSPWGKQSGAHINPAVTLGFWQLGKIRTPDALWYLLAQVSGAVGMGQVLKPVLGAYYTHPAVNFIVTQPLPLPNGTRLAFAGEFLICFVLMLLMLVCLYSKRLKAYTGWVVGLLLALFIIFETPYSGMSLNPARTLGSAVAANSYHGLWLYWVAPCMAMWLATVLFRRFYHGENLECAILAGCGPTPSSPHAPEAEPPQYPDQEAA
ncbi:MIP/aquaporin family protein [Hymenobacter sp. DG25A]|uniref:MIP/aquaporin family protein n=1 Tax=Hymenobacter sp. DG25A TaxID=1385663 RepID=UPI0006C85D16|nr:aquaporin [Hymenobacter sp. DG25A]